MRRKCAIVFQHADLNNATKSVESDMCSIVEKRVMFDDAISRDILYVSHICIDA